MPKKQKTAKKKPQNKALRLTIIVLGAFLLLIGATVLFQSKPAQDCANSESCISNLSGEKELDNTGEYMGQNVTAPELPEEDLYALEEAQAVLGETTNKRLYVDLSRQRLYAFEGNTLIYDFPVSTGKWYATPTGEFRIWTWLRYTRMSGGSKANGTYYNLPNVPYTMYFGNAAVPNWRGYGIHGAYWHNNFGQPMSHGCVNMRIEDAGKIFEWTYWNKNLPLVIYGTTPRG